MWDFVPDDAYQEDLDWRVLPATTGDDRRVPTSSDEFRRVSLCGTRCRRRNDLRAADGCPIDSAMSDTSRPKLDPPFKMDDLTGGVPRQVSENSHAAASPTRSVNVPLSPPFRRTEQASRPTGVDAARGDRASARSRFGATVLTMSSPRSAMPRTPSRCLPTAPAAGGLREMPLGLDLFDRADDKECDGRPRPTRATRGRGRPRALKAPNESP
jgi:hypothetical protein